MRIVAVAVQTNFGLVCIGRAGSDRHDDVLRGMRKVGVDTVTHGFWQGFVTDEGHYVNRVQAYAIAEKAGQIIKDIGCYQELYSEHLW